MKKFIKGNWIAAVWIGVILAIPIYFASSFLITKYKNVEVSEFDKFIIDIEKKYQDVSTIKIDENANDYNKLVANIDKQCPFVSTASTGECLDRLISKKETELINLIAELKDGAIKKRDAIKKEYETSAYEWDNLLEELPKYDQAWKIYSESFCGIKTSQIGGSAIVEESRKCKLFQIEQYIQLLKDQKAWAM